MAQRISVAEAAKLMGVSPQFIRVAMQRGVLPIGTAIQISGRKWTYHISPALFNKYLGGAEQ